MNINRDLYNCTFPELIADWRQTFHVGSRGQTEELFPFGFVQVCGKEVGSETVGLGCVWASPSQKLIPSFVVTTCHWIRLNSSWFTGDTEF